MKNLVLSVVAISSSLCVNMLYAGDMGPAVVPTKNWTGFYAGGNIGGAWASSKWNYQDVNPYDAEGPNSPIIATTNNFTLSSLSGGAQLGYNYQFNQWVLGPEVAFFWTDLNKDVLNAVQIFNTQTVNTEMRQYYTVTGRIGSLVKPDWLLYGKGGYAHTTIHTSGVTSPAIPGLNLNWDTSGQHNGWIAGGGLEYRVIKNLTVGVEYNYLGFNNVVHTGTVSGGSIGFANEIVHQVDAHIQNVMARVNILFA